MCFFQNPEVIFYHFFRIFNLDIFLVLILQKHIGSRYLDPVTPTTVLSRSFWNFTGALRMVWRHACCFFRILKLFFITGFLLQYLGKWYRTNGPLVNFTIFNTSNKNKVGDINSPWNLLVYHKYFDTANFSVLGGNILIDYDKIHKSAQQLLICQFLFSQIFLVCMTVLIDHYWPYLPSWLVKYRQHLIGR